jgi:hypothetical protein
LPVVKTVRCMCYNLVVHITHGHDYQKSRSQSLQETARTRGE